MIGSTHFWNDTFDALVTGAATTEINLMEMDGGGTRLCSKL